MLDSLCAILETLTNHAKPPEERALAATALACRLALERARAEGREEELARRFPRLFRIRVELAVEPAAAIQAAGATGATGALPAERPVPGPAPAARESGEAPRAEPEPGWVVGNKPW